MKTFAAHPRPHFAKLCAQPDHWLGKNILSDPDLRGSGSLYRHYGFANFLRESRLNALQPQVLCLLWLFLWQWANPWIYQIWICVLVSRRTMAQIKLLFLLYLVGYESSVRSCKRLLNAVQIHFPNALICPRLSLIASTRLVIIRELFVYLIKNILLRKKIIRQIKFVIKKTQFRHRFILLK